MNARIAIFAILFLAPIDLCGQSCGHHSRLRHQHLNDGYWRSYFELEVWSPHFVRNESETTLFDSWVALVQGSHPNEDCAVSNISIKHTKTFEHSVEIVWGGEISASAEGAAKLWFWRCKAAVGAKVDWHRSGKSTETESLEISVEKGVLPCQTVDFYYEIRKMEKRFESDYARARSKCRDHKKGVLSPWHYCNDRHVTVTGRGYVDLRTGWRNAEKLCDCVDGVPVFPPDESG